MNILALDTTTSACSVALVTDEAEISRSVMMERGHAEALLPMVRDVLNEASRGFADIDALAVTVGPGAFTGLRIGLAAARGMALAAGIPCVGVTSLEAIAEGIGSAERAGRALLVVLDSKRGDLFAQVFDAAGPPLGPPLAVSYDGLMDILPPRPLVVAGTAASAVVERLVHRGLDAAPATGTGCPHAGDVARVAARRRIAGETTDKPPSPLYLRPPDTGAPKPERPTGTISAVSVLPPEMVPVGRHHAAVVAAMTERCLEQAWSGAAVGNILATPGAFGFIALVSDTPAAFILCRAAGGECEVLALGTVPGMRRSGIARRLVERAVEEADVRDARRIVLEVAEDNAPARGLYAGSGFSLAGRRSRYYRRPSGAHADALILSREWRVPGGAE